MGNFLLGIKIKKFFGFIEKGNNFNNYISSISRINFFIQLTNEEIVFQ
jgi:hypothetical protein